MNAPLVIIGSESIQLAMQIDAVPEERLVKILAPKGSDQPLDEWMRARHEGDRLEFLDVENSQIRAPAIDFSARALSNDSADVLRVVQEIASVTLDDGLAFDSKAATAETTTGAWNPVGQRWE